MTSKKAQGGAGMDGVDGIDAMDGDGSAGFGQQSLQILAQPGPARSDPNDRGMPGISVRGQQQDMPAASMDEAKGAKALDMPGGSMGQGPGDGGGGISGGGAGGRDDGGPGASRRVRATVEPWRCTGACCRPIPVTRAHAT